MSGWISSSCNNLNSLVSEYDATPVGEEEQFEVRHIIMAVTDWQLWLHVLLLWSVVGPGQSHAPPR